MCSCVGALNRLINVQYDTTNLVVQFVTLGTNKHTRAHTQTQTHTNWYPNFSSPHAVFVFQCVGCLYDFFMWLLPKIRYGTPDQTRDAQLFTFHHAVVCFLNMFGLPVCHLTFYACSIGIMEGTGFFLGCLRLMQRLNVEKSNRWYIANGICFWLSWTIVRVMIPQYILFRLYTDWQIASDLLRENIQIKLLVALVVAYLMLVILNFVWYIKICKLMFSSACQRAKKQ